MNTNDLVTHKKLNIGIGCVAKVLSKTVEVNFGTDDVKTCSPKMLDLVDVRKCKTISYEKYRKTILSAASKPDMVILGNEVREYVGIGWLSLGVVTLEDLKLYPRVI